MMSTELRDKLVKLYPAESDQRRLVEEAGLSVADIAFDPAAKNSWNAILRDAKRRHRLPELIEAVKEGQHDVTTLRRLAETYAKTPEPGDPDEPGDQSRRVGLVLVSVLAVGGAGVMLAVTQCTSKPTKTTTVELGNLSSGVVPPAPSRVSTGSGPPVAMKIENPSFEVKTPSDGVKTPDRYGVQTAPGWKTWSPNRTESAASVDHPGGRTGAQHLTHWIKDSPYEVWTYQTKSELTPGNYKVRAWVRKRGSFNIARLQAKTCGSCGKTNAPPDQLKYKDLDAYEDWTLVETPVITVTGGSLELGLHSQLTSGSSDSSIHMDDVELIKL